MQHNASCQLFLGGALCADVYIGIAHICIFAIALPYWMVI